VGSSKVEDNTFQAWRKERFEGELNGSELWNRRNDWAYKLLQMLIIIFSALTTASLALGKFYPGFPGQVFAIFGSLIVTCAAGSLKIFNFQGKALYYAYKYDSLMREQSLYKAIDGDYSKTENKEQLFVRRVEDLISEANRQREEVYFPAKSE
jgi:hypothetical protein